MMAHSLPTTPGAAQPSGWQRLAELPLSAPDDLECKVSIPLRQAFQALGVPAADQERLINALITAVAQITERGQGEQPAFLMVVRLLVLPSLAAAYVATQDAALSTSQPPSRGVNPTVSNGWSFFLVEHSSGSPLNADGTAPYVLEVFLYREGQGG